MLLKTLKSKNFKNETLGKSIITFFGVSMIVLTLLVGFFLFVKGVETFTTHGHSISEFLFSSEWAPLDDPNQNGGGSVGASIYIFGSIVTCGIALLIATPFSVGAAIFLSEILSKANAKIIRPAIEIFVGIPSVVYGWVGYTVLVPIIKMIHPEGSGDSVIAAAIVLAVMIFPTITTVAADAISNVSDDYRKGAYGLGSTRWQVIKNIVLPSAKPGILTGIVLGLARAFGEALAVGMVIGKTRAFPTDIFSPTYNLTTAISADMGNSSDGSELNSALWTMALLLFVITIICILVIHLISKRSEVK